MHIGGDCHGSVEYIAKRTDSSTASVQRALNYLVKNNFVTKTKTSHKRPSIYVANYNSINHNDSIIEERINQNDRLIESKCECDSIMMIDNNKENNKEILTNYDVLATETNDPKGHFGRSRVVRLSYHQLAGQGRTDISAKNKFFRKTVKIIIRLWWNFIKGK